MEGTATTKTIFDDDEDEISGKRNEDTGGEINDEDVENLKRDVQDKEARLLLAQQQRPPKSKKKGIGLVSAKVTGA